MSRFAEVAGIMWCAEHHGVFDEQRSDTGRCDNTDDLDVCTVPVPLHAKRKDLRRAARS